MKEDADDTDFPHVYIGTISECQSEVCILITVGKSSSPISESCQPRHNESKYCDSRKCYVTIASFGY